MEIKGKTLVITGASSGIGAATALAMAKKGAAKIALLARTASKLKKIASSLQKTGVIAVPFVVDLSEPTQVIAVAQRILTEFGTPDILINNAGAGRWLFPEQTSLEEALSMTNVPYLAAFGLTSAFLTAMMKQHRGHIVNISSPACFCPWPGATAYSVARWAMRGLSESLQADLKGTGVNVSLVVPSEVSTEYFKNNPGSREHLPKIAKLYPLLTPESVAEMIIQAIEREQRLVVRPRLLYATILLHRLFPKPVEWLLSVTGARRPVDSSKSS